MLFRAWYCERWRKIHTRDSPVWVALLWHWSEPTGKRKSHWYLFHQGVTSRSPVHLMHPSCIVYMTPGSERWPASDDSEDFPPNLNLPQDLIRRICAMCRVVNGNKHGTSQVQEAP